MTYEQAIRAHDVADYCELIVRKAAKPRTTKSREREAGQQSPGK